MLAIMQDDTVTAVCILNNTFLSISVTSQLAILVSTMKSFLIKLISHFGPNFFQ